jgi:hypothetical protein
VPLHTSGVIGGIVLSSISIVFFFVFFARVVFRVAALARLATCCQKKNRKI